MSTYNVPQASYSHVINIVIGAFREKRSIYFTNNIDVSKKHLGVKKMESVLYNNKMH